MLWPGVRALPTWWVCAHLTQDFVLATGLQKEQWITTREGLEEEEAEERMFRKREGRKYKKPLKSQPPRVRKGLGTRMQGREFKTADREGNRRLTCLNVFYRSLLPSPVHTSRPHPCSSSCVSLQFDPGCLRSRMEVADFGVKHTLLGQPVGNK